MRSILLLCSLLLIPTQAWAACRCACVRGVMRPICQQTDMVEPICTGLCTDSVRPETVVKPLFGGQQAFNPVEPFDPAPPGLVQRDLNLSTDTRGNPLGTAGVQGGSDAFSSSAGGAASR
ncbi:hypothetical protein [Methylobacterium brachiatum]|jgi:hypothetical protein|uniref:hypothetical protein n=1 Tax=Methylobacterium brachiatum TaxID=269660 RepID=UPI00244820E9|nr:hypothetical protein [Methylobacterium brachiatum]MDF2599272.1 protein of unassigned function [Methylobacterium brachiatum]MDH2314066.1 hypothetical protein [Methylobacterium brachiatum]